MGYDKTTWVDKETLVDAQKLNKIEDQLDFLNKKIEKSLENKAEKIHIHESKDIKFLDNQLFCTKEEKEEWNKASEKINNTNNKQYKLAKDLQTGSKIKFGKYKVESETAQPIIFIKADNNHYKDSDNPNIVDHITLIAEKIIDLRAFDATEPNNSDSSRKTYGNNNYKLSNQRQWLNSNQLNWFSKTHNADESTTNSGTGDYNTPYDTKAGFLNLFSQEEINAIVPTNLKVALNTVTDGGGSEIVNDKVFLLSETEAGLGNENGIVEGKTFSIFSDNASRQIGVTEQCFNNTKSTSKPSSKNDNWYWWLRTPYSSYSYFVRSVYSDGSLSYYFARIGRVGVRPALNLNAEVQVSNEPDADGCYTLIFDSENIQAENVICKDGKSVESHLEDITNKTDETKGATLIGMKPITGLTGDNVRTAIQNLFQYANDGKTAVANAVTAKGVSASPSDTFSALAIKIGQISTGRKVATGKVYKSTPGTLTVSGLGFTPTLAFVGIDKASLGYTDSTYKYGFLAVIQTAGAFTDYYSTNESLFPQVFGYKTNNDAFSFARATEAGFVTNGFKAYVSFGNANYNWIAIE